MICSEHQRLLLDSWKPGTTCCHHEHREEVQTDQPLAAVSFAMSRAILRRDGMVLPIGGAVCQPCRQRYIQQHIPGLKAISNSSTPSLPPSTPPRPSVSLPTSSLPKSGPLSPEEIKRKISSLQPLRVISSPASSGRQKFFVLQPNEEGPVETVVFEDAAALRTGRDSPVSDSGSITVKEERIIVEDIELGLQSPSQNKKKEKTQTSTPNKTSTQSNAIEEGETREASEKAPRETQAITSPTLQSSGGTYDDDNIGESDEAVEAGIRKSEEYKFFCKLCHIGFLKETSYKYHFANNIELHKKMKRTTGKVSLKDLTQLNPFLKFYLFFKQERKCDDCGKSFSTDKLFRKHMYNDHKLDDPFFCKICNIVLKNESAYKSHHR